MPACSVAGMCAQHPITSSSRSQAGKRVLPCCRRERTGCPVAAALPIESAAVGGGVLGSRQGVCSIAPWVARLDPQSAMAAASQAHEPAVASSRHTQLVGAGECAGMCGQRGTAAAAHQGSQLRQVLWWRVESCIWGRCCCPQLMQQCGLDNHDFSCLRRPASDCTPGDSSAEHSGSWCWTGICHDSMWGPVLYPSVASVTFKCLTLPGATWMDLHDGCCYRGICATTPWCC